MRNLSEFQIIKDRIEREKKNGDIGKACDKAGITRTTFARALEKESIDDLSDCERSALNHIMETLDERKRSIAKLKSYAK